MTSDYERALQRDREEFSLAWEEAAAAESASALATELAIDLRALASPTDDETLAEHVRRKARSAIRELAVRGYGGREYPADLRALTGPARDGETLPEYIRRTGAPIAIRANVVVDDESDLSPYKIERYGEWTVFNAKSDEDVPRAERELRESITGVHEESAEIDLPTWRAVGATGSELVLRRAAVIRDFMRRMFPEPDTRGMTPNQAMIARDEGLSLLGAFGKIAALECENKIIEEMAARERPARRESVMQYLVSGSRPARPPLRWPAGAKAP